MVEKFVLLSFGCFAWGGDNNRCLFNPKTVNFAFILAILLPGGGKTPSVLP